MTYFIDYIQTNSNVNNKGRELQQYILRFTQRLVKDDLSMDALKSEIGQEIERLNKAYPRARKLALSEYKGTRGGQWKAWEEEICGKTVFVLSWKKVLGTYCFSEKTPYTLENPATKSGLDSI